eukprot:Hpha_TRINITY_DN16171_c3_g2::TRINITY_DN16171_c3_g2_i1::g.7628::m.7628
MSPRRAVSAAPAPPPSPPIGGPCGRPRTPPPALSPPDASARRSAAWNYDTIPLPPTPLPPAPPETLRSRSAASPPPSRRASPVQDPRDGAGLGSLQREEVSAGQLLQRLAEARRDLAIEAANAEQRRAEHARLAAEAAETELRRLRAAAAHNPTPGGVD